MASSNPQTNEGSSPSPSILSSINTAVNISVYTTQNLIAINASSQTPIKLTQHNFSAWRLQFYTLLVGYDLLGYVNGTLPCPSSTLTSEKGTTTPNPAYTHWIRQDHLLNAIVSSLSPTIFSFIASATTSLEAWSTLHNTYAKASRSRIIHYRTQLDNLSKGTQSITQYMQFVKICVDVLYLMNVTIDPEDFIIQIFHGLPEMYKDLHSTIHAHETVFPLRNFMRNCFLLRLKLYENLPSILLGMSHCLLPPMLLPNNHNRIDSSINSLTLRLNTVHPNNLNQ